MNKQKPKTYNEIVRMKKCQTLANYYSNITENMFNEVYNFLAADNNNSAVANRTVLSLVDAKGTVTKTFPLVLKNSAIDGLKIGSGGISVIDHYTPSSGGSSGGSSSNNNNIKNNNNNNNKYR